MIRLAVVTEYRFRYQYAPWWIKTAARGWFKEQLHGKTDPASTEEC